MQLSLTGPEAKGLTASANKKKVSLIGMGWRIQYPLAKK
jgi:hypothetical protein